MHYVMHYVMHHVRTRLLGVEPRLHPCGARLPTCGARLPTCGARLPTCGAEEPGSSSGSSRELGPLPRGRTGCAGFVYPSHPTSPKKHTLNPPVGMVREVNKSGTAATALKTRLLSIYSGAPPLRSPAPPRGAGLPPEGSRPKYLGEREGLKRTIGDNPVAGCLASRQPTSAKRGGVRER